MEIVRQGYGQTITLETGVDITGNTGIAMIFKHPSYAEKSVTGTCDDTTVGDVYWATTNGFFTVTGDWKAIARVTFGTDEVFYTRPVAATVVDQHDAS